MNSILKPLVFFVALLSVNANGIPCEPKDLSWLGNSRLGGVAVLPARCETVTGFDSQSDSLIRLSTLLPVKVLISRQLRVAEQEVNRVLLDCFGGSCLDIAAPKSKWDSEGSTLSEIKKAAELYVESAPLNVFQVVWVDSSSQIEKEKARVRQLIRDLDQKVNTIKQRWIKAEALAREAERKAKNATKDREEAQRKAALAKKRAADALALYKKYKGLADALEKAANQADADLKKLTLEQLMEKQRLEKEAKEKAKKAAQWAQEFLKSLKEKKNKKQKKPSQSTPKQETPKQETPKQNKN